MTDLLAGIDATVTKLKALTYKEQPLRVCVRNEDIQPPCVWVAMESVDHDLIGGEQLLRLFLVSGDIDEYRGLKTLSGLLDVVLDVISPTEATTIVGVNSTKLLKTLAALRVTTTLTI